MFCKILKKKCNKWAAQVHIVVGAHIVAGVCDGY